MKCVMCDSEASHGEYLFLDWGEKRDKVDAYLVAACPEHCWQARERVVKMFGGHGGRAKRGPLAGGSIIHVIPLELKGHDVIVWSNAKNFSSWDRARRIRKGIVDKDGEFRALFGNPRTVKRLDWRGWGPPPNSPAYNLQPLTQLEYGRPFLIAFLKRWAHLPVNWEPTPITGFPLPKREF